MNTFSEYILEVSADYQIEKYYCKIKDKINLLVNKN